MDPKVSKKTQNSLGKIIKRPPLTDKLLAKPPFRFLHDIVTSVINTTGFMQGLYSTDEQNSDHVKDKESKIAFLQKALDMVSLVTGKKIPMKPVKVVSGHEPEKTNEFLQMLAEAINKQVDNDSYVQRVLSSKETNKSHSDPNKEKDRPRDKSSSRRSEKERSREKSERKESSKSQPERHKENENDPGEKDRQRDKAEEKERRHRKTEEKVRERSHRSRTEEKGEKERDPEKEREKEKRRTDERSKEKRPSDADRSSRKTRKDDTKENEKPSVEKKELDDKMEEPTPRRLPRPTSAKGSRQKREESGASPAPATTQALDESSKQPIEEPPKPVPTTRPSSARPAPPKQKKPEVITTDPIIQLGSGRPTNVITDDAQESDEDEQFIVEDNTPLQMTKSALTKEPDASDETEHGGLVKKILETTKELEGTQENDKTSKTQIDNSSMTNAAYQKQRHLVVQKIEKLQESIQTLTKSANPLGKIMDYIQEDLDSMQKELQRWKQERIQHTMALRHEKEITERTVEPLKMQLTSLEQAISDQMDVIATVKANVIRNDKRIVSLLHSVAKV